MSDVVRVLVADDSRTVRAFLTDVLSAHPAIQVVAEARDGVEALELTSQLRPSIVIMDAVMPVMDGFEATARIMAECPTPVLVVTAALDATDVALALRTVEVGALAVMPKPTAPQDERARRQLAGFVRKVVALSQVRVIRRYPSHNGRDAVGTPAPTATHVPEIPRPNGIALIAAAASTGGPRVVLELLRGLPSSLPVPILLVQHIADGFIEGYVRWLDDSTDLRVQLAVDGRPIEPGVVHVAPEDRHLRVGPGRQVVLDGGPAIGGFRPAATAMFESVAQVYGATGLGVILSGLGDDGLTGLLSLHAAGGLVLAQDEATSAVFGMPGAVVAAGIARTVAPVSELVQQILQLTSEAIP